MDKAKANEHKGLIFNIQRYSLHDGPGIRTVVFLKGCPMSCLWCANPESQCVKKDIFIRRSSCIGCGACVAACPTHALQMRPDGVFIDRTQCLGCAACTKVCNANGLSLIGEEMTTTELLEKIMQDKIFYQSSGGGVTFSGGEPFMQAAFLLNTLKMCKGNGLDTVIETCGMAARSAVEATADYVDHFYCDIKMMDPDKHAYYTGMSNKEILANITHLAGCHKDVLIRMALIPGINDDVENIHKTAAFLQEIGLNKIQILPYHAYGAEKYRALGREYTLRQIEPPQEEAMKKIFDIFHSYKICTLNENER